MRVLSINTYGGSLLLGATAMGADIIGSYEDAGYGTAIQAANFPHLDLRPSRAQWPKQDLSDVIVLAHPPCSAFSQLNNSQEARGTGSDAFTCTRHVLDYAIGNGAVAIAIESVMGALAGAWFVHQEYADKHGYHLYRVLQNGSMFGPQWRDRFWALWVKKGAAHETLDLLLRPTWTSVGEAVRGHENGPAPVAIDGWFEQLKTDLIMSQNLTEDDLTFLFRTPRPSIGLVTLAQARFWPDEMLPQVFKRVKSVRNGSTFMSSQLRILSPDGLAPTVLADSWFCLNDKTLSEAGYKLLMGFPFNYRFPETPKNYRKDMRSYLSKGVIPSVAAWVLGQLMTHLGERHRPGCPCHGGCNHSYGDSYRLACEPDRIADFRFHKKHWRRPDQQPALVKVYEEFAS